MGGGGGILATVQQVEVFGEFSTKFQPSRGVAIALSFEDNILRNT